MAYRLQTTTKKHKLFVSEPIGDKQVTELAGIGEEAGKKLRALGFEKAHNVLGKFLALKKDRRDFIKWLTKKKVCNEARALECYNCLEEWSSTFI